MSETDRLAVTRHEAKKMTDARKEYGDIINRPHHVSKKRSQMSKSNRAAQFSPFAALTGYDDLVRESARVTSKRVELSENDLADINARLHLVQENISMQPQVTVIYFEEDQLKSGGAYVEYAGAVAKIKPLEQCLVMEGGLEIAFGDIISIAGGLFKGFDD